MPPNLYDTTEWQQIGSGAKRIIQILLSSDLQRELLPIKIVFIIFALFFAWMIVYYSVKTTYWDYRFLRTTSDFLFPKLLRKKAAVRKWEKIQKGMSRDIEEQWKLSLIEAASFLDSALKSRGFGGYTLEERLNNVPHEDISNIEKLKTAQKICSDIIHDQNYHLEKSAAKEALSEIESALKQLEVL